MTGQLNQLNNRAGNSDSVARNDSPGTVAMIFSQAIAGNVAMINQLHNSISGLEDGHMSWQHSRASGTIGQHTRHIIDHYTAFFDGLVVNKINYDARACDPGLESSVLRTSEKLAFLIRALNKIPAGERESMLLVTISTDPHTEAIHTVSTATRELVFLQSHTIHHMALIRMLFGFQGIDVGQSFGYSPSTLKRETRDG